MAATPTVAILSTMSLMGFTSLVVFPQAEAVPWKEVVGMGSAGCVLLAMWLSNKHVEKVTDNFSETTTTLFKENRADNEEARKELQDLLREIRRPDRIQQ